VIKLKIPWKEVYYLGFNLGDYIRISEPELLFVIKNKPQLKERLAIDEEELIKKGVEEYKNFWGIFFTIRDLILRGYRCRLNQEFIELYDKGIIPGTTEPSYLIYPISESNILSWEKFVEIFDKAKARGIKPLLGIVDWEGSLTYYEIREFRP